MDSGYLLFFVYLVLPSAATVLILIVAALAAWRWDCLLTRSLLVASLAPAVTLIAGYGWAIAGVREAAPQPTLPSVLAIVCLLIMTPLAALGAFVGTWCLAVILLYPWRRLRGNRPAARGGRFFDLALLVLAVATLCAGAVLAVNYYEGHALAMERRRPHFFMYASTSRSPSFFPVAFTTSDFWKSTGASSR